MSRIAGEREFYGRAFHISPATLDPRADTETLVEAALDVAKAEGWDRKPIRVLDVGTGSGCLLVTLLAELPLATGLGTDISPEALLVAEGNAARHGVAARARFAARRSLSGIDGTFDLLVSNPPYIRTADIAGLAPEVRDHDPPLALDGGLGGLDIYLEIADKLAGAVPDGWALFEVGAGEAQGVLAEVERRRYSCGNGARAKGARAHGEWRTWTDLGGHVRCIGVRTGS